MARGKCKDTRTTAQKLDDIVAQIEAAETNLKELKSQNYRQSLYKKRLIRC